MTYHGGKFLTCFPFPCRSKVLPAMQHELFRSMLELKMLTAAGICRYKLRPELLRLVDGLCTA